jgi:hypothetical protein
VPGGLKYQPIRDVPLKDEFDEWLARVVCFAFSIPPTAFARETNRATAETALGTAIAEGLQPLLVWLKGLIDRIISQVLGCDDLEFAWSDRTAPDPQVQVTIAAAYVAAGIKTRNEVRAELGLEPIAGGDTLTRPGRRRRCRAAWRNSIPIGRPNHAVRGNGRLTTPRLPQPGSSWPAGRKKRQRRPARTAWRASMRCRLNFRRPFWA